MGGHRVDLEPLTQWDAGVTGAIQLDWSDTDRVAEHLYPTTEAP